jgi:hypothetical protein
MRLFETGRWPSIADRDDLKQVISEILDAGPEFDARFYQTEAFVGGFACQGDIVQLTSAAPCIDAAGNAIVPDATFDHWMIVGNTCDMHRDDEPRSLIAPLVGLAEPVPDEQLHTPSLRVLASILRAAVAKRRAAASPPRRLHAAGHHREGGFP